MNSICPDIDMAIKLSIVAGNSIKEKSEGWSKAKQVFFMERKLTLELKDKIHSTVPKLEYWVELGSPHNEPEEGFYCNECTVGMSFPCDRKIIR